MNSDTRIDEILEITSLVPSSEMKPEPASRVIPQKNGKDDDIDYNYARENYYNLIERDQDAVEEMLEIAKSLRTEFYELGEVSTETKKRLKEVLEDKNKREKFAEVLSKEVEEEESFDEFMINLISEKDRDN